MNALPLDQLAGFKKDLIKYIQAKTCYYYLNLMQVTFGYFRCAENIRLIRQYNFGFWNSAILKRSRL